MRLIAITLLAGASFFAADARAEGDWYATAKFAYNTLDDQDNVILTSEFHYAVGRESVECVSGGIDPPETPEQTACRELREELGIVAANWTRLTTIDPFTTIMESPTCLFIAEQLTSVDTNPEGTETIRPVRMPLRSAANWVLSGKITHAPSCILILMAERIKSQPPVSVESDSFPL